MRDSVANVPSPSIAIDQFWSWWSTASNDYASAIARGDVVTLADQMSTKVHAIHPNLDWELSEGQGAAHALCLSAVAQPEVRALPHRWLRRAPASTPTWEYHAARIGSQVWLNSTVDIDGHNLEPREIELALTLDHDRQLLSLSGYHPAFADLREEARVRFLFLAIDWSIGETDVERWIGPIETTTEKTAGAVPIDALPEIVESLAERNSEVRWSVLQGKDRSGAEILVTARRPLKPVDYPLFDLHGAALFPLSEGIERLQSIESDFESSFAHDALLAAAEVRAGTRTLHFYCDQQTQTQRRIEEWVARQPATSLVWTRDPAWDHVAAFR